MAKDNEYELLPHSELEYLRKEVERMKRNPLGDTKASTSLLESINHLNDSVKKLLRVFESANTEMVKTFHDNSVQEEVRKLREENAKIAHGIVAVAELVKEVKSHKSLPEPVEKQPPLPEQPAMTGQPNVEFHEEDLTHELHNPDSFTPGQQPIVNQQPLGMNEPMPPMPPPGEFPPPLGNIAPPPGEIPPGAPPQEIGGDEVPPPPPK